MTYAIDEGLVAKARELGPLIREHAAEAAQLLLGLEPDLPLVFF